MRYCFSCVLLLLPFLLPAQNLVINPGFEELKAEQEGGLCYYFNSPRRIDDVAVGWYDFSWATPDLIVYDSTNTDCKPAVPRTGKGMAGLYLFVPKEDVGREESYREFLVGRLRKPLVKGEIYEFSMWIQRNASLGAQYLEQAYPGPVSVAGFSASHLGVLFSTSRPGEHTNFLEDSRQFGEKPRVEFKEVIAQQEGEWIHLSAQFKVWQACQYFVIGNYEHDVHLLIEPSDIYQQIGADNEKRKDKTKKHIIRYAYYTIDDLYIGPPRPAMESALLAGNSFRFEQLNFQTASAELEPGTEQELNQLLQLLQAQAQLNIRIEGHTDQVGDAKANQKLSENRAQTVYHFLIGKGIAPQRLSYQGFGESRPIADNEQEEGRRLNRRVEIVVEE